MLKSVPVQNLVVCKVVDLVKVFKARAVPTFVPIHLMAEPTTGKVGYERSLSLRASHTVALYQLRKAIQRIDPPGEKKIPIDAVNSAQQAGRAMETGRVS